MKLLDGEDDALTQKAVELQKKHIKNLLIEPRFVASLTTAEVREHFDRFRKMFGGSLESRGPVCKICGRLCEGNKYGNYVVCDCTGNRVRVSDADYIVIFPTKE
ncbi:uncharacterized protein RHO25_005600 [Cercospora beticola]|nr:hypothetical protein RHO25_005600 [Cercospora beticola]